MRTSLDLAIVGCGTAGAAAALFLARAGHRVTVYEAVPEPRPLGAGILLQPSGLGVLARLGLRDRVVARGSRVESLRCRTRGGRPVLALDYAELHPAAFGLGLHRGVLFDELFDAVNAEPRIRVELGVELSTTALRANRRVLRDRAGREVGAHELVLVADGARSELRRAVSTPKRAEQYAWGALWAIVPDVARTFQTRLSQVVHGTTQLFGILPTGLGPEGDVPHVSLFWSLRNDQLGAVRDAGLDAWKSAVLALEPAAAPLLDGVSAMDELIHAVYHDVELDPLHGDRIALLGDAAHAMSPQLGQGANLALLDAEFLAAALATHESRRPLGAALARYSAARREHVAYYLWANRLLTPFFQSDLAPLGWLRDAGLATVCRLPIAKEKMLRTLAGVERGVVFGDPLPLTELTNVPRNQP